MNRGSERFHEINAELGALHDRKQQDYGRPDDPFANVRATEDWSIPAWVGAMIRLNDKVVRLKSYRANGSLANEGVEDSMRDIAVYAIIALVLFEQDAEKLAWPDGRPEDIIKPDEQPSPLRPQWPPMDHPFPTTTDGRELLARAQEVRHVRDSRDSSQLVHAE